MNPDAKTTNRGGWVAACVAKRMRGCLPPRTGCGCPATISPRNALSRPVGTRVSHESSASSSAGTSRSRCRPVQRGQVHPRRPLDLHELPLDLALEVVAALLVEQVPLVVGHDERAAGVDDLLDDPDVLLGDRLLGVDEDDRDLGLLQGGLGAQRRVEVRAPGLVHPAPDARRVDEPPRLAAQARSARPPGRGWCRRPSRRRPARPRPAC